MVETITANLIMALTVSQVLDSTNTPASSSVIQHNAWNKDISISATASSSVPEAVTKCAAFTKALSSGSATIDLTALTGTNGATVDFSTLKVQAAYFENPSTNANNITVTFGASNGYLLAGTAWKVILAPGQAFLFRGYEATPDVGSSAKNIDLSGTAAQTLRCVLIAG